MWCRVWAALLALACAGCAGGGGGAQPIELWAMGREGEVVAQLAREFERGHPGLAVHVQQVPWSAAHEKLLTAFVGGALPDVVQVGSTWIPELTALGALAPLDERIARSAAVRLDDWFPGVLATHEVGGRVMALPWYVDTRLFFYRSDLLAAAGVARTPASWDEWLAAMRRLSHPPQRWAIFLPVTDWVMPVVLALQRGAELLRDDARWGNFQSPPVRDAFAFYRTLFTARLAPPAAGSEVANVYREFAAGYFAVYPTGPWDLAEFARRLPPARAGDWATAPMPGGGAGAPGLSLAGGAGLALVAGSPRQDEAWRLVEWLAEPAQQVAFHRLSGDLPARRSAWEAARLRDDPRAAAFWVQLQHLAAPPAIPEWERIATAIGRAGEAIVRGGAPLEATLAGLDREVDAILAKRRWLAARGQTS